MNDLREGQSMSNFTILSSKAIPEYKATGIFLRHRTGCLAYHLLTEDSENLFAFAFRTPPANSRGAAHIIEHSVLAGSRSFRVKDPFLELMKGSVNTFLNAMTYPDKTVYPASSTVEQDYFNLMRVYGDAVFFPLLRKEVFHQEGRRFELTPDGKLQLVGVVYNEMLGNYSEQDSIVGEWSYRALFPDSPYRFDSGGEPEAIPDLTYEEFRQFHETYYHPANCLIFLYGNIPTERQLAFIDEHFLGSFDVKEVSSSIEPQPRWSKPRATSVGSPVDAGDDLSGSTSITLNWLAGEVLDPKAVLAMEVLSELLLGNAGAPLHKAIVESHLGEDLSPQSGLDTDVREMVFTVGVRGSDADKQEDFERLVFGELERLVREGIPEDVVQGALKRVEFRNREIPGGVPFGLRLMGKTLRGWLHGSAPETTLEFARWMEEVKRETKEGRYFERLIQTELLSNPHRTTVIVRPDPELAPRRQETLAKRLESELSALGPEDRERLRAENESLRRFQDLPDNPDDLARIPSISLRDIPREVDRVETQEGELEGIPLYRHDLFTNGIVYLDLAFDLSPVPAELLRHLPLFSRAICGLGFPGVPYDEVARRLALRTGGIFSFLEASGAPLDRDRSQSYIYFRLKVLEEDLAQGVAMLLAMIRTADFNDTARIRDLLQEMRNDFKSSILPRGNSYAALRAGSRLSRILAREEEWSGTAQLLFLDALARSPSSEQELSRAFQTLRELLLVRRRLAVNVTGEGAAIERAVEQARQLIGELPSGAPSAAPFSEPAGHLGAVPGGFQIEAFAVPSDVGYAATALPGSLLSEREHGHEVLLAHLLRTDYLWEKIRMRGGAYGTFAGANGTEGLFSFSSYRDPKIATSLSVFRESLAEFAAKPVDSATLTKAIIGSVGRELRPMSPGEKSLVALRRRLYGITDEMRQANRDVMLSAGPADIARASARLLSHYEGAASAIIAGKKMLSGTRKVLPNMAEAIALPV